MGFECQGRGAEVKKYTQNDELAENAGADLSKLKAPRSMRSLLKGVAGITAAAAAFGASSADAQTQNYSPQTISSPSHNNFAGHRSNVNQHYSQQQTKPAWMRSLAKKVIGSNVSLIMRKEGDVSIGSGTLVIPPKEIVDRFLYPDEVLIVSVSHNLWDWTEDSSLSVSVFSNFDSQLKPKDYTSYENARLINRYRKAAPGQSNFIDVALIACRIPPEDMPYVQSLLRPMAAPGRTLERGEKAVTIGCPGDQPGLDLDPDTGRPKSMVRPPVWLEGRSMSSEQKVVNTQYGPVNSHTYRTATLPLKGHSGGGLFNEKAELVAVCSGGGEVKLGTQDFYVEGTERIIMIPHGTSTAGLTKGTILVRSLSEMKAKTRQLAMQQAPWALKSKGRATYQSVEDLHTLIQRTVEEWDLASAKVACLRSDYLVLKNFIENRTLLEGVEVNLVGALQRLGQEAGQGPAAKRLLELKPPRR